MSVIGSVPGQKKKKKKDLKIGERLKKLFKGKKGSKMSLLGNIPGTEKNTPAKKNGNKTKKLTGAERAKAMAKARIKSGKTINDLKMANKAAMKARAKARYEAFKKKRKK